MKIRAKCRRDNRPTWLAPSVLGVFSLALLLAGGILFDKMQLPIASDWANDAFFYGTLVSAVMVVFMLLLFDSTKWRAFQLIGAYFGGFCAAGIIAIVWIFMQIDKAIF